MYNSSPSITPFVQSLPPAQGSQSGPPQSTPVSAPFISSSVHVGQASQSGPPQSTPASFPFSNPSPHNSPHATPVSPPQSMPVSPGSWTPLKLGSQGPHSPPQSTHCSPSKTSYCPFSHGSHASQIGPPQSINSSPLFKMPSKQFSGILLSSFRHPVPQKTAATASSRRFDVFIFSRLWFPNFISLN